MSTWFTRAGTPFSVEGTLTYRLSVGQENVPVLKRHFQVTCADEGWQVAVMLDADRSRRYYYQYDGTNLLSFSVHERGLQESASGSMERSAVPQTATSAAGEFVWLAYASTAYFQSLIEPVAMFLRPLRSPEGLVRREHLPCEYLLDVESPRLPNSVKFYRDVERFLDASGTVVTNQMAKPFRSGYLLAQLTSSGRTNIGGLSLPVGFEYREYLPEAKASTSNDLRQVLLVTGRATNFHVPSSLQFYVPSTMHVRDDRPPEVGVHYPLTNSVVPALDDSFVSQRRQDAAQKAALQALRLRVPRFRALAWITATALLLPVLLWFLARRRGGGESKTQLERKE